MEDNTPSVRNLLVAISLAKAAAISTTTITALKITGQINWDWAWVLSPVWIPVTFNFIYAILCGVVIGFSRMNSN